jgi:hypothetical protein
MYLVRHDGHSMERRLPIEQDDVAVNQVPLDDGAQRKIPR